MSVTKRVSAAALAALLAACGGGGGGGGGVDPADISTPESAAQVLIPVLSVANGSVSSAASRASAAARTAERARAARAGAQAKAMRPAGQVEDPCPTSGDYERREFTNKDVESPFTTVNFTGYTDVWHDCTGAVDYDTYTYTYSDDGVYEYGYAPETGAYYDRDNEYEYKEFYDAKQGGDYEHYRYHSDGVVHSEEGEIFSESIDMNFGWRYSWSDGGDTDAESLSVFVGSADEPFIVERTATTVLLDGRFGTEGNAYPDCQLGKARVLTPQALVRDGGTNNLTGVVELSADGHEAEITLLADGGATISVDGGAAVPYTAQQIQTLRDMCPDFGD